MAFLLIWLMLFEFHSCENVTKFFEEINDNFKKFNALAADIAWQSSLEPGKLGLAIKAADYQKNFISWQHDTCQALTVMHNQVILNKTQERQAYLLCRGPKYCHEEVRQMGILYDVIQEIYYYPIRVEACVPKPNGGKGFADWTYVEIAEYAIYTFTVEYSDEEYNGDDNKFVCLKGERDFEKIMKSVRNPAVLEWVWWNWREYMEGMRLAYRRLVEVENMAAKRNGYKDIGDVWRDELEMPNPRAKCHQLYKSIKPLYALLHGVVRYFLRQIYLGMSATGPIPTHFLGDLWSQNWESLADLILSKVINLDNRMKKLNWTEHYMMKRAEDFYVSLGLPPMTEKFWRESVYKQNDTYSARCHGTAADMFKDGDLRLLYCPGVTFEDFNVIHHEMGHIQYYMAYEKQPALFRQANSVLHESIGDTIMYGVMTPQHLHRLRLISDPELYNLVTAQNETGNDADHLPTRKFQFGEDAPATNLVFMLQYHKQLYSITTDEILIFKQALNKLPQIPFALLMDEYRWRYFEGSLDKENLNEQFWEMAKLLQGITPSFPRNEEQFDIAAKFHVPDNTPYIHYFLSSFLQHQLFESLCKAAVLGHENIKEPLPDTISLNRCDIYGSKAAGKILKDIMSRGASEPWQKILSETTGINEINSVSLKRYYRPLYKMLKKLVLEHDIPIGW